MRKFKRYQPRSLRFRLLLVVAGALLLGGAFVPRAHAQSVIAYWNFEDGVLGQGVNLVSDAPGPQTWVLAGFGVNPYVATPRYEKCHWAA